MKNFIEWLAQEGLLLPDKPPAGLTTRINPTPFTLSQLRRIKGKPTKFPKPKPIKVKKHPALQVPMHHLVSKASPGI